MRILRQVTRLQLAKYVTSNLQVIFGQILSPGPVLLEPSEHLIPTEARGVRVIARPVVSMKALVCAWVDYDL